MSKTTKRLGMSLWSAYIRPDGFPSPSIELRKLWEHLDELSKKKHGKPYDSLTGKQKLDLHHDIAVAKEAAKEEAKAAKRAGK